MSPREERVLDALHQIAPASNKQIAAFIGMPKSQVHKAIARLRGAHIEHHSDVHEPCSRRYAMCFAPVLVGPMQKTTKQYAPARDKALIEAEKAARRTKARAKQSIFERDMLKATQDPWGRPINKGDA